MKLYGSLTSPYVRRSRLALTGQDYEFIQLNINDEKDREVLIKHNPARKIPLLLDGDTAIYDSGIIYRYLAQKFAIPALSWAQENQLTLINAVNDSLIELLFCKRSGFDINDDKVFFNLQRERVAGVLHILDQQAAAGEFSGWDYPEKALYSLIDWILFRELVELDSYPALLAFHRKNSTAPGVTETDPRLA